MGRFLIVLREQKTQPDRDLFKIGGYDDDSLGSYEIPKDTMECFEITLKFSKGKPTMRRIHFSLGVHSIVTGGGFLPLRNLILVANNTARSTLTKS